MKSLILLTCLLQTALAAPQLISFKDGKVGVNFLGYHAEAGLGGGQNGANGGLLGGLHASAGTPWGQNAAAGLGGSVNGRAAGGLYAGAQATPDVGASAVLGGDTSQGGFSGTDAYANGKVKSRTRTIVAENTQKAHEAAYPQYPQQTATESVNAIQKIRPPKKYYPSESYDFVEKHDYSLNHDISINTNKNKNVQQDKPDDVTSIVSNNPINKTAAFATPLRSDANYNIAPTSKALAKQSLNIDSNLNNYSANNDFNKQLLASSTLSATPSGTPSSVSFSHSLNGDNTNGYIAKGVNDNDPTGIISVTRERTKLRTHAHKHHRNRQQKRINANRQRQSSKTFIQVVGRENQQQQQQQQQHATETQEQQQNTPQTYNHQQQRPVRRRLIAPPAAPTHPCDSEKRKCENANREVRSAVVENALQIPIGILKSLQESLGK